MSALLISGCLVRSTSCRKLASVRGRILTFAAMSNHLSHTHPSGPVTTLCGKKHHRGWQPIVNAYAQYSGLCKTVNTKSCMPLRSDHKDRLTRKTSEIRDVLCRTFESVEVSRPLKSSVFFLRFCIFIRLHLCLQLT